MGWWTNPPNHHEHKVQITKRKKDTSPPSKEEKRSVGRPGQIYVTWHELRTKVVLNTRGVYTMRARYAIEQVETWPELRQDTTRRSGVNWVDFERGDAKQPRNRYGNWHTVQLFRLVWWFWQLYLVEGHSIERLGRPAGSVVVVSLSIGYESVSNCSFGRISNALSLQQGLLLLWCQNLMFWYECVVGNVDE